MTDLKAIYDTALKAHGEATAFRMLRPDSLENSV